MINIWQTKLKEDGRGCIMISSLDVGLFGNCRRIGALIAGDAETVWYFLPRYDGDAVFC